jgi:hypothetical protein
MVVCCHEDLAMFETECCDGKLSTIYQILLTVQKLLTHIPIL